MTFEQAIRILKKGGAVRYKGIDLWFERGPDGETLFGSSIYEPRLAILISADSVLSNEWEYGEKSKKKISIRPGIFETNSSSTHSIVLATEEEAKGLKKGSLWFNVTYDWESDKRRLADPDTGLPLPMFVDEETAERVWEANSRLPKDKRNRYLEEELINTKASLGNVDFLELAFFPIPSIDEIDEDGKEDGKIRLDITYFFG